MPLIQLVVPLSLMKRYVLLDDTPMGALVTEEVVKAVVSVDVTVLEDTAVGAAVTDEEG